MSAPAKIEAVEPALLEIQGLQVSYGEHQAVKEVSFSIAPGETLALVGESGCGKSTTAMSILRLLDGRAHLSGQIRFAGEDLLQVNEPTLRSIRGNQISMVFQDPMTSLNPVLTIGEQITEVLRRHRGLSASQAQAEAIALLERVQIPEPQQRIHDYPHNLSGGQRQRVMIAIAVACRPRLLIADEPTTALDVTIQAQILQLLRELSEEYAMGLLLITHDLGVVGQWADRVVVMYDGRIVESGTTEQIFTRAGHAYTRGLLGASLRLDSENHYSRVSLPEIIVRREEGAEPSFQLRTLERTARLPLQADNEPRERILQVQDLHTQYKTARGPVHAVNGVSFEILAGETVGLVGESGCGKSTLSRTLLGLVRPSSGRILLKGQDVTEWSERDWRPARPWVQMVFQDPYGSLNPKHSIFDILEGPLRQHGVRDAQERRQRIVQLLDRVGLPRAAAWKYPHEFSGGQRQRIGVARALILRPSLVICDEAVSSLDVSVRAQILNLLAELKDEFNLSYLFISHDLSVVKYMADRVLVMNAGQIVEQGSHDRLWKQASHAYTRKLIGSVPVPRYRAEEEVAADPYAHLPVSVLLSRFAI